MPIDNNPNPEYKKAMVVVAHPDDAEYGCSGTVAQSVSYTHLTLPTNREV